MLQTTLLFVLVICFQNASISYSYSGHRVVSNNKLQNNSILHQTDNIDDEDEEIMEYVNASSSARQEHSDKKHALLDRGFVVKELETSTTGKNASNDEFVDDINFEDFTPVMLERKRIKLLVQGDCENLRKEILTDFAYDYTAAPDTQITLVCFSERPHRWTSSALRWNFPDQFSHHPEHPKDFLPYNKYKHVNSSNKEEGRKKIKNPITRGKSLVRRYRRPQISEDVKVRKIVDVKNNDLVEDLESFPHSSIWRLSPFSLDQVGTYKCLTRPGLEVSRIHIYIKDPRNPAVRNGSVLVKTREFVPVVLPCLVTHPR